MSQVPMTKVGAEAIREELDHLKGKKRHSIIDAIATARAHGDLSENAEYHAAKEEQSFNEGRIGDLEDKIARAQVIDPTTIQSDKVVFGATVSLIACESEKEVIYQIVGEDEADLEAGKISITSPVARSMIGKEEGEVATVRAPGGEREYEIQSVSYI
ncbi:MAG: transcription elongation factor GreA [Mariprofundaceae bacterium]